LLQISGKDFFPFCLVYAADYFKLTANTSTNNFGAEE